MSVKLVALVFQHSRAQLGSRLVALALADFSDDDGYCWPRVEKIAAKCRLSIRQVQRATQELERLGELVVDHQRGHARDVRYRPNAYRLLMVRGAEMSPLEASGVTNPTLRGDKSYKSGVTNRTLRGDTNVTQNHQRGSIKKRTVREPSVVYAPDFLRFYDAYPKKKGKAEAFDEWQKLAPDAAQQAILLESLERQKQDPQWTRDSGQYVPELRRWLKRRRWEDVPTEDDGLDEVGRFNRNTMRKIMEEHGSGGAGLPALFSGAFNRR